jgi:hypothetical protein
MRWLPCVFEQFAILPILVVRMLASTVEMN